MRPGTCHLGAAPLIYRTSRWKQVVGPGVGYRGFFAVSLVILSLNISSRAFAQAGINPGQPIPHRPWLLDVPVTIWIFIVALVVFQRLLNFGKRRKLYGVGLLFLCGLGIMLCVHKDCELFSNGKNVEATVISDLIAYRSSTRHSHTDHYRVTYRFATAPGVTVEGSYMTEDRNVKPGSAVSVVYLPDHPEINQTHANVRFDLVVAALLILLLLIGAGYLVIVVWLTWRLESRLLAIGAEAPGTMRAVTRPGFKGLRVVYIYTFQDSQGKFHSGQCDATAAFITSGLDSGDTGKVKYDPHDPSKNMWFG